MAEPSLCSDSMAQKVTCTSQMAVVASKLAVDRYLPSGDQLLHRMLRWCVSSSIAAHIQVSLVPGLRQILTVLSPLQLAMLSPARLLELQDFPMQLLTAFCMFAAGTSWRPLYVPDAICMTFQRLQLLQMRHLRRKLCSTQKMCAA